MTCSLKSGEASCYTLFVLRIIWLLRANTVSWIESNPVNLCCREAHEYQEGGRARGKVILEIQKE